jgi:hypothetical protein
MKDTINKISELLKKLVAKDEVAEILIPPEEALELIRTGRCEGRILLDKRSPTMAVSGNAKIKIGRNFLDG